MFGFLPYSSFSMFLGYCCWLILSESCAAARSRSLPFGDKCHYPSYLLLNRSGGRPLFHVFPVDGISPFCLAWKATNRSSGSRVSTRGILGSNGLVPCQCGAVRPPVFARLAYGPVSQTFSSPPVDQISLRGIVIRQIPTFPERRMHFRRGYCGDFITSHVSLFASFVCCGIATYVLRKGMPDFA